MSGFIKISFKLKRKMKPLAAFALGCFFCLSTTAQTPAYEWSVGDAHVEDIEASYMPNAIAFKADKGGGTCPAGKVLRWNGSAADLATRQANVKSVFAMLVAARLAGTTIKMFGLNTNCEIKFIYLE